MNGLAGLRLLITTDAVGGVWIYSVILARALARRGCDVTLVTLGPPPRRDQLWPLRASENLEIEVTDFALEWMDPQGDDCERSLEGLHKIGRRLQPDIVHLNGYREGMVDWRAPVLVAAHSCVRSWWLACRGEEPSQPCWNAYSTRVAAGLAAADIWVAPSSAFRDCIQALYAPPVTGAVVHNGIECVNGFPAKEPFILSAGRLWDEAKNVAALKAAAAEVGWPVRLAGAVTASDRCEAGSPFELLGDLPRRDLLGLMARAAIYVAPALYEPFGLGVLEAGAAGCALVLSDIPTFRELWSGAALFVDPHDARDLGATLRGVCGDAGIRGGLQTSAAIRARRYSAARMVESYCELYRHLLAAPARRLPVALSERCA